MRGKKRYIELTSEQKVALESGYKNGLTHDFRSRCHCILLSSQKWSVNQLTTFFEVTNQTILQWFNRFEAQGVEGLRIRSGRGRKRKLDIDNAEHVKAVKIGLTKENRSIKQLRQDLESKLGTSVGDTTLRDFLKVLVIDSDASGSVSNPSRMQGRSMKK